MRYIIGGLFTLFFVCIGKDAVAQPTLNHNQVVGIDKFGRTFEPVSSLKQDKQVGIFFWLWIGQPYASGIYDATEILGQKGGYDLLFHKNDTLRSPSGQMHFWGKPLWGYYNSEDEWVIRKQIQMLTYAGMDFLVFDATNALTYKNVYMKILAVIDEYRKKGWNAPKIVFYTHSLSLQTTQRLYDELYKPGLYPDTWYRKADGKPVIIAYTEVKDDLAEAAMRGDKNYKPVPLSKEILDFFHFEMPQWPSEPYRKDGFAWVEWTFPQPLHTDMMNVTVASHPNVPFSFSLTRHLENWGRGWNPELKKNIPEDVDKGTFFQRQWDHALQVNPDCVFVGGWNEWVAYKQLWDGEYMLCDAVDKEYSRDIEPMEGGYEDAFYIQLIRNIRAYKGVGKQSPAMKGKTIKLRKSLEQWNTVAYVCPNIDAAMPLRDNYGVSKTIRYTEHKRVNQIKEIKVTHDEKNLYFYIACSDRISPKDASSLPVLFIGTGMPELKGWNGYEYKTGAIRTDAKVELKDLNADFTSKDAGTVNYVLSGNIIQMQIPRASLELKDKNSFYFKAAIGVDRPSEIASYYRSGSVLPLGRLSYFYKLN